MKQDKAELCHPFPPSTAQDLGPQEKNLYFYIGGEGVEKKAALCWVLLSGSFLFHRAKEDFEGIKVV